MALIFPEYHMAVGKSVNIRAILEYNGKKFQYSSAALNIKHNSVMLFLSQLYLSFFYASKHFLIDHQTEFSDLEKDKIY